MSYNSLWQRKEPGSPGASFLGLDHPSLLATTEKKSVNAGEMNYHLFAALLHPRKLKRGDYRKLFFFAVLCPG